MIKNPYSKLQPKTRKPYTEIYLIRHANPNYSLQKKLGDRLMPLSAVGRQQSQAISKILKKLDIDVIYSSELARAQETAGIFAGKRNIVIEERLNEIDWKRWHRVKYFRTSEDRRKQYLKNYNILDAQLDKMQTEMRRALADIFLKNKGKKVAIFCHGNIIKSLLTSIINADVIGFLSLEIYQASISKLVIDKDGYVKVAFINDVNHLPYPPGEDLFVTLLD
jgi:broad specificity phosphatase PhoE